MDIQKFEKGNHILDFYATWCEPCKALKPIIKELKEEYKNKINIEMINVSENPELRKKFKIMSVPTLIYLKDGEVVSYDVGFKNKKYIENKINELFL